MDGKEKTVVVMGYRPFKDDPGEMLEEAVAPPQEVRDLLQYLIHQNFGPPVTFLVRARVL